jgi:hypothetical protein
MPAGLRNVRVVSVTSSDFEELLVAGLEELAMRYDKDTLEQLARWRLKFLNFETELQKASPSATLSDVLPAYNAYLRRGARGTAQGNRHSTVYHNMWMTRRAMQYLEGREIGGMLFDDIQAANRRQFVPTTKAYPLRYEELVELTQNYQLDLEVRAFAAFLWLSTQRGGNVLDVAPEDLMMDPERPGVATMCYLTRRKGQTLVERLMPVVQEWELGPFENLLQRWRGIALRNARKTLFSPSAITRLTTVLGERPLPRRVQGLRARYTLYSIKRGALQHLAAQGAELERIAALSLHNNLSILAVYIGSFLNPRVTEARNMTRMLTRPSTVPIPDEEFPREPFAPRERSEPEQVEPPMLNRGLGRRRAASETERELAVLPQMVLRGGRALRRGEIHQ